jgi:hypothetical protein
VINFLSYIFYLQMANSKKSLGVSRIPLILSLTVLAFALPLSVKLVQQNQENRSNAAGSAGSVSGCLVYRELPPSNEEVYAVSGSTFCDRDWFLGPKDSIYKCVDGKGVAQKIDCNSGYDGCYEIKGSKVSSEGGGKEVKKSYWKFTAKCRDDKGCTNLGGTCSVDVKNGPKVDQSCKTTGGKDGVVKSDLCLSKANFDTKRCCVPGAKKESCYTTSACSNLKGRCDDPKNKKSNEKTVSGVCPGGSDCVCIVPTAVTTGVTRCKPGDKTKLLRQIKYTGSNNWVSYTTCSKGTYCTDKYITGVGTAAVCLKK